ncbi:UbiD family decarboxylase [Shinella sp. CPCC 100929]|uniref:UbiD family decarboxylase n=2 Tax=Rhizobiaceae TaxID=82115 RepID=A0ABT1REC8_9HYPH|nr:UbiD family decarboxylase [Shinella lacus]
MTVPRTPPLNLNDHLDALDAAGLLVRVDRPINKDTELHPLVRWQFLGGLEENDRKAFLFTNVVDSKGRKYDMPVLLGALAASPRIYAMGMGRPVEEIGDAWNHAIANPIPPNRVTEAPCQAVVIQGEALTRPDGGVAALPVPVSTPGFDSAPYLTATMCITRDPETGVQNAGMYRAALKAPDRMVIRMAAKPGGAGGWLHWLKYRERAEKMPIAIALGAAPVVVFTSPQKLPVDVDEFSVAGGLAGQAIDTVKCVSNDLEVPADAEIVIEGYIDTSVLEPEAPFGESNGYVALEGYNMPMIVTAITHKRKAIFNAIISQVTPSESSVIKKVAYEPLFLHHLSKQLSIKGIKKVVLHERLTNLRPVIFLQYAYGTPRSEVWRGLYAASSFMGSVGKIVIAISEDIDPNSVDAILWSMAYRSTPSEDVLITPNRGGVQGAQYGPSNTDSGLLIDATQKRPLPPLALPKKEFMENAKAIWEELGLPAIKAESPWHGYTLGDWTERWETLAQRATASDWQLNGDDTLPRQHSGKGPEDSARNLE